MGTRVKIILAVILAIVLSGCANNVPVKEVPKEVPKEMWDSAQKSEFLSILAEDKYLSICNQQALYEKTKESQDNQLMTVMLVAYTKNLANGCLVNASRKEKIDGQMTTTYETYEQKVSESDIKMKLQARQSIEQILEPYVPEYGQFNALIAQYNTLKKAGKTSPELLYDIRLNIERVKLLKPGLGNTYALVNIPEYQIRVIEDNKTSVTMKVIVGTKKNKTPVFSENLQYITLNPTWNVPDSIARNEIIPDALRDPGYLKSHRLVIRKDYDLDSPALSFNSIDAKSYKGGKGHVPFKFIEIPSDKNALGRVKFIFPNNHSVYMHDTPTKHLFKKEERAFSHGCIRLGDPKYMLEYISKNYTAHEYEDVKEKYDSYKTHYLKITKHLPVHTAYLTTYVDQNGKLLVFSDVYNYNKIQELNF
ncbi:L,D-transpeptidase family protein [Sulfurovum sp.]|uniref:L,D-transpeptidase family protein n=1 Tax=Sulfurovum sp. TaxID=1969726 RepID=UPI0028680951|nr:L,D-transpeptidase family protein [Sulfurovum sp.]